MNTNTSHPKSITDGIKSNSALELHEGAMQVAMILIVATAAIVGVWGLVSLIGGISMAGGVLGVAQGWISSISGM